MSKCARIRETAFQEIQLNAGIAMSEFDPETGAIDLSKIIAATTGGLNFTATPTYSDFGEDIDNCPKNMMELKKLESWEVKMTGTYVTVTPDVVKSLLGVADVEEDKITPRSDLKPEDFSDIWLVCDYSDKNGEVNGGFVAIHMINALSTTGFALQTADKAKGQFAFEYTAHYSMDAQTVVPFEVYVKAGTEEAA